MWVASLTWQYSGLPIYRGHFAPNNSRKTSILRPLGRNMGVFCEFEVWPKFVLRSCCVWCDISRVYGTLQYSLATTRLTILRQHCHSNPWRRHYMVYCIIGPLYGESTIHRRNTMASNVKLWCPPFCQLNILLNKQSSCWLFRTPRRPCDVAVVESSCATPRLRHKDKNKPPANL